MRLLVACLRDAPVLILDEPRVNLDPEGAIGFRRFLLELRQKGKTIVFSSHILVDVERLADRVGLVCEFQGSVYAHARAFLPVRFSNCLVRDCLHFLYR